MIDEPGRRIADQIEAAFRDLPPLDSRDLVTRGPDALERDKIRSVLAPWTWKNIPGSVLVNDPGALSFLTPLGFRMFVPACMLLSLASPRDYGLLLDSVVFHLRPRTGWESDLRERLNAFSESQLKAVRDFLVYMREREAAEFERGDYDAAIGAVENQIRADNERRGNTFAVDKGDT